MPILPRNSSQEQRRALTHHWRVQPPIECTRCDETDPTKFYYDPDGHRASMCRACKNDSNPKKKIRTEDNPPEKIHRRKRPQRQPQPSDYHLRKYGISIRAYIDILNSQNGVCCICGNPPPPDKLLSVDHCHETGKVRGLLCSHCNSGIGFLQDSPELLRKAIEYLER